MRVRAAEPATTQIAWPDAEGPSTAPPPAFGGLRERLARLGAPAPKPPAARSHGLPSGFDEVQTPFGVAVMRADVLALPSLDPDPGAFAYVDTETTGLNGGSGTYVFTAAVARPLPHGMHLAQVFLPEPGMEPAFLHALREELRAATGIATFNGGSFDLPILRTRWVMARMPGDFDHPPHVDLLTLVRALYRHRLETCTLRYVEERVLGYERDDPLPSAQVPDAYFSFLRFGSREFLEAALEHNRLDVISLVHLHSRLLRRLGGAERAPTAGGRFGTRRRSRAARRRRRPGCCSPGACCAGARSRRRPRFSSGSRAPSPTTSVSRSPARGCSSGGGAIPAPRSRWSRMRRRGCQAPPSSSPTGAPGCGARSIQRGMTAGAGAATGGNATSWRSSSSWLPPPTPRPEKSAGRTRGRRSAAALTDSFRFWHPKTGISALARTE